MGKGIGFSTRFCASVALGLLIPAACGADGPSDADKPAVITLKSIQEDANDAARAAREVVRTMMSDEEFQKRVKEIEKKYKAWNEENREDIGRFLNDRLVSVALGATSGKEDRLKEGAVFLALYREFKQPLPSLVTDFVRDNHASLQRIFGAFTWKSACAYVKNKQWKKDAESSKSGAGEKSGEKPDEHLGEKTTASDDR